MSNTRIAITISRQLGCGGAEIGRIVAETLGYHYADREIVQKAAKALGLNDEDLTWREEAVSSVWDRIARLFAFGVPGVPYSAPPIQPLPDEDLFALESQIVRELGSREDCVIVGRGGESVLRQLPGLVSVYLHAPARFRIRRVMQVYGAATEHDAIEMMRKSDAERREYNRRVVHCDWGCADNYHLTLDSSVLSIQRTASLIVEFARLRRTALETP